MYVVQSPQWILLYITQTGLRITIYTHSIKYIPQFIALRQAMTLNYLYIHTCKHA